MTRKVTWYCASRTPTEYALRTVGAGINWLRAGRSAHALLEGGGGSPDCVLPLVP